MKIRRILFLILSLSLLLLSVMAVEKTGKLHYYVEKYNGVYYADDGNIISLYDYHGKDAFMNNLDTVTDFAEECPLDVYVAIPPRKMDALTSSLPEDFPHTDMTSLFKLAEKEVEKSGGIYVDLHTLLAGKSEYAGQLYFKTDHHWTSQGAYLAYREIVSALGKTPLEEDDFEIVLFTDSYRGSDYNKHPADEYDEIYLYYSEGYPDFKVTEVRFPYDKSENNVTLSGMYLEERLDSFDPYTVYFGGNVPYITISRGQRETLLVIRDSFASALAPLIAQHFNVVMVDPRFYPSAMKTVIEREEVDLVLILENMGSYTENTIKFKY